MTYAPTIYPRSLYLLWSFCTLGLSTGSPSSLTAQLATRAGGVGDVAAIVFGAACFVLLADMLVNDVLPKRFSFPCARSYRWLCVSSMAIVYWMFGTIALLPGAAPPGSWVLIAGYFGVGAWGMSFAFYNKVERYRTQLAEHSDAS